MNPNKHDNFLNSAVLAVGVVGLLLAVVSGPSPNAAPMVAKAVAAAPVVVAQR